MIVNLSIFYTSASSKLSFGKYLLIFLLTGFVLVLTSCLDTEPEPILVEHFIDNRLNPYFELFKEEAAARDIDIDFKLLKVDGYIQTIPEIGVAGQCQTYENNSTAIVIQPLYWKEIDELQKEFLIFHELGHCVLKREHLDDSNPNGTCKSIMNSGGLFCDINYNERTRKEYIDELFLN